jgi:hypothetical protein
MLMPVVVNKPVVIRMRESMFQGIVVKFGSVGEKGARLDLN